MVHALSHGAYIITATKARHSVQEALLNAQAARDLNPAMRHGMGWLCAIHAYLPFDPPQTEEKVLYRHQAVVEEPRPGAVATSGVNRRLQKLILEIKAQQGG